MVARIMDEKGAGLEGGVERTMRRCVPARPAAANNNNKKKKKEEEEEEERRRGKTTKQLSGQGSISVSTKPSLDHAVPSFTQQLAMPV